MNKNVNQYVLKYMTDKYNLSTAKKLRMGTDYHYIQMVFVRCIDLPFYGSLFKAKFESHLILKI